MSEEEEIKEILKSISISNWPETESRKPFPAAVAMTALDPCIAWHPRHTYVEMMGPELREAYEVMQVKHGLKNMIHMTKLYRQAPWETQNYYRLQESK